jgi:hypothetical protein
VRAPEAALGTRVMVARASFGIFGDARASEESSAFGEDEDASRRRERVKEGASGKSEAVEEMESMGLAPDVVHNAYSVLADAYAYEGGGGGERDVASRRSVEASTANEGEASSISGVHGVAVSTDRAREQYERVLRAIGSDRVTSFSDSVAVHEESGKTKPIADELDLIIENVRVDGSVDGQGMTGATVSATVTSSRSIRDDQSEIAMLQDVIDDMTTEKLGLMRGLQKSQAMVDEMARENEALTQRYNETKSKLTHVQGQLDDLWLQYQEHAGSVPQFGGNGIGGSHHGDAHERVRSLAAEVVSLEERLYEFDKTKLENSHLEKEAKAANARAADVELVLEATREEQRLFKETIRESSVMRTLEDLQTDDDSAALLCGWLNKRDSNAETGTKAKESSVNQMNNTQRRARAHELNEMLDSSDFSDMDEEQQRILSSINELLGQLETEKKSLARQLASANESRHQLLERNGLLESQLAKTLNRLALGDEENKWIEEERIDTNVGRKGVFGFFRRSY